jgi:guanosine-3',5'-bis(diphosphate) 3'-pyrophosphohydrolase
MPHSALRLDDIVAAIRGYAPNADVSPVIGAYMFGARAHQGQVRKSGEDYWVHPVAVAGLLADMRMDVDTIAVGLLHDTMEDCLATREALEAEFGVEVADMVEGVTKIGKLDFKNKLEAEAENFRKLVLAMAKDIRVILVKLADRLHNMRTMEHMKPDRQRAISVETMDIYAPIANRLGLSALKMELEDHAFRYIEPEIHAELAARLGEGAVEREAYTTTTATRLQEALAARGLRAEVSGRAKHLVSIHRKMQASQLPFEQIHDILAFRVFVEDAPSCYVALGHIHQLFHHIPERLKDYIAVPKSNGYQSLHTVVIGPEGRQIEVQIRTPAMHRVAELGIAAHWRYKEGHLDLSRDDLDRISRLRELFEAAREVHDPAEFMATVKVDLFAEEIFVFTPRGDVKFLPKGATVLDFAYAVHTEVGHTCAGAKVNGRQVSLRHVLHAGDSVEVQRRADQKPSRDWLEIARTGRALSKIRWRLREVERDEGRETGRQLLDNELRKRGFSLAKLQKSGELLTAATALGLKRDDTLFLHLADGTLPVRKALAELVPADKLDLPDPAEKGAFAHLLDKVRRRSESPVIINGETDLLVQYARCCGPLPGEPVVGYITRGRGITVHVAGCRQILGLEPERRVPVQWHREAKVNHTAELRVLSGDTPGMLADIANVCKANSVNISRMSAHGVDGTRAEFRLEVSVVDVDHLQKLVKGIQRVKGVLSVERLRDEANVA